MSHQGNDQRLRELLDEGCSRVRACCVSDHSIGPYGFTVVAADQQAHLALTRRLVPTLARPVLDIYVCVGDAPGWDLEHSDLRHLERLHVSEEGLVGQYDPGHRYWSIWDGITRRGLLWIESLDLLPTWHRAAPFRSILHWALQGTPYTLAHAGVVGSTLLVGKGGSGKSTTVAACALAGLPVCGDDLVVLGLGQATALYDAAKLRSSCPLVVDGGVEFGDKFLYRLSALGSVAASAAIRSVVLPTVSQESTSRLSACSSSEALRALAPSTVFMLRGGEAATVAKLSEFVRSVPAYRLLLGADYGVAALKDLQ